MVKRSPFPPGNGHIHHPEDGRRHRHVYLNGKLMRGAVYVDVRRGLVRAFDIPPKVDKRRKRVITRTYRGIVAVEFISR